MNNSEDPITNGDKIIIEAETIKIKKKNNENNNEQVQEIELATRNVQIIKNENELQNSIDEVETKNQNDSTKEMTKKEKYLKYVKDAEDSCEKCPLRCLACIPICIGYGCLAFFDYITYLFVPMCYCLFYCFSFLCNSCKNILSTYQVEEEIGFSGAFTSENEIKLHINEEGGAFHLTEILCFSYFSACVKRYFCFLFVLINHILVPILQSWKRAKKCFMDSKIEELYDERVKQIEEESKYKGYDQIETQIEV
jgi:hypothetical protein